MTSSRPYSGRVKWKVCRRLHDTWRDLADVLDVPVYEQRRFTPGFEPQDLWEWLAARHLLGDLARALTDVGRSDLLAELTVEPAPVALSSGTQLLLDLSASAVRDANVLIDTGQFGTPTVHLAELYVRRTVEDVVVARARRHGITAVVGEPGTGKTSLLWALARRLCDDGTEPLFIKATDLASAVTAGMVTQAVRELRADGREPVLLVDTLDVLLHRGDIPPVVVGLLRAALADRVAAVLTCRVVEARLLDEVQDLFRLERRELLPYDEAELGTAIEAHTQHFHVDRNGATVSVDEVAAAVNAAVARGLPLREICQNPLTLRMLFELADGGMPDTEIDTVELYDRYWTLRVRGDRRHGAPGPDYAGTTEVVAETVALVMLAAGVPEVPTHTFRQELDEYQRIASLRGAVDVELATLHSRGVLKIDDSGDRVRFFHQTFMEYAAARAFVNVNSDLIEALLPRAAELPDDLFLAAITHRAAVACGRSTSGALRVGPQLQRLLTSAASHQRALGLTAYAQSRTVSTGVAAAARRALAEVDLALVNEYIRFLSATRHADLERICGDLRTVWDRGEPLARWWVLDALRRLASRRPDAVIDLLETVEAYQWILGQPVDQRQNHGNPAIALVESLASVDAKWAGDRLVELVEVFGGDMRTWHGLTRVLATAARCVRDAALLEKVIDRCPAAGRKDAGVSDLERALAGCYLAAWRVRAWSSRACLDAALAAHTPGSSLRSRAHLIAVGEVILADPDGDALVEQLLACEEPHLRSDIVEHVLRPVIQGPLRPPVPGHSVAGTHIAPVTAGVRARAVRAIADLAGPENTVLRLGSRPIALALRDALDYSSLPVDQIAALFSGTGVPRLPEAAWTDLGCAAALAPAAALGGHQGAASAMAAWCRQPCPPAPDPLWDKRRQAICGRLQQWATSCVPALDYLLLDADRCMDPGFLVEPVTDLGTVSPDVLAGFHKPLIAIANVAIGAERPDVRTAGYRVLAAMINAYAEPPDHPLPLLTETDTGVLNAVLDVIDAALAHRSDSWPAGTDPALLDALRILAYRPRGRGDLSSRAATAHRTVLCRMAPVDTRERRQQLLATISGMLRDSGRQALRPVGYLMSRMAEVEVADAAALLRETSLWIATHGAPAASWKSRIAKRWRTPIKDIVERQRRVAWLQLMRDLTAGDQFLMIEAIDISLRTRPGRPEDDLAALLGEVGASDRIHRAFAAARRRHHRVAGGASTWPQLSQLFNRAEAV